jgi:DNA-binding MarR family transcriptional regulator
MHTPGGPAHTLEGFPAAAISFVRALEHNRERIAKEAGLSASELAALFRVAAVVSTTPKELAVYLGMTTGAITAIARKLVAAKLLHRVDHPLDHRSLYLELTPHAHTVMDQIHTDFRSMLALSTEGLSEDELAAFTQSLLTVSAAVRARIGTADAGAPTSWRETTGI